VPSAVSRSITCTIVRRSRYSLIAAVQCTPERAMPLQDRGLRSGALGHADRRGRRRIRQRSNPYGLRRHPMVPRAGDPGGNSPPPQSLRDVYFTVDLACSNRISANGISGRNSCRSFRNYKRKALSSTYADILLFVVAVCFRSVFPKLSEDLSNDARFHFPVSSQFSATCPRILRFNHTEESIPKDSDAVGIDSKFNDSELDLHRGLSRGG